VATYMTAAASARLENIRPGKPQTPTPPQTQTQTQTPPPVRELAPPGDIATASQRPLPFEFKNVEMAYDSYRGLQVRCR